MTHRRPVAVAPAFDSTGVPARGAPGMSACIAGLRADGPGGRIQRGPERASLETENYQGPRRGSAAGRSLGEHIFRTSPA